MTVTMTESEKIAWSVLADSWEEAQAISEFKCNDCGGHFVCPPETEIADCLKEIKEGLTDYFVDYLMNEGYLISPECWQEICEKEDF